MLKNYSDEKTEMLSETLMVKLRYEEIIKKLLANESDGKPESIEDVIKSTKLPKTVSAMKHCFEVQRAFTE